MIFGMLPMLESRLKIGLTVPLGRKRTAVVKTTKYFQATRIRPDRAMIQEEWIQRVVQFPENERIQADGRIRRWAKIEEMEDRYLRVILLPDGETIHNAFFDRGYIS